MRFRMLGPLEVVSTDRQVPLGGTKQRATLGYLLLQANKVVPTSQLLSALWNPDSTPATARKILQNAVWGLRGVLAEYGPDDGATTSELLTRVPGYMIRVNPEEVDLHLFRMRVRQGRASLATGAAEEAVEFLCEALDLWRGPVLADLVETGTMWPELTAVQNTRLDVLEDFFEAKLQCGQHYAVLGQLETTVEAEPLRERASGQLMLALYRCGRQADALSVYNRIRATLVEDLGLEPGHELRRLQQAILGHDPVLSPALGPAVATAVQLRDSDTVRVSDSRFRQRDDRRKALTSVAAHRKRGHTTDRPAPARTRNANGTAGTTANGTASGTAGTTANGTASAPAAGTAAGAAVGEATGTATGTAARIASGNTNPAADDALVTERQHLSVILVQARLAHGAAPAIGLGGAAAENVVETDELLDQLNSGARSRIERAGGRVVASIGSVTLGLFRPGGEESAALRAVRAAVAIRDSPPLTIRSGGRYPPKACGLTLHASVATGQALVRFCPEDLGVPPSVNGALLDLCHRLLTQAPAGEIQVCDTTRLATERAVAYRLAGGSVPGWRVRDAFDQQTSSAGRWAV